METDQTKKNIFSSALARQKLVGKVVSDKMKDTAVVSVERFVKHKKYQKFYGIRKRFKAHNAGNVYKTGDTVVIESCRPISKDKHFVIIKRA